MVKNYNIIKKNSKKNIKKSIKKSIKKNSKKSIKKNSKKSIKKNSKKSIKKRYKIKILKGGCCATASPAGNLGALSSNICCLLSSLGGAFTAVETTFTNLGNNMDLVTNPPPI